MTLTDLNHMPALTSAKVPRDLAELTQLAGSTDAPEPTMTLELDAILEEQEATMTLDVDSFLEEAPVPPAAAHSRPISAPPPRGATSSRTPPAASRPPSPFTSAIALGARPGSLRPQASSPPGSAPPAADGNPFLSRPPPPQKPMFDDVNTAFASGQLAPDFAAFEQRASRPDFDPPPNLANTSSIGLPPPPAPVLPESNYQAPPPMRAQFQSIDFGAGVVVETLADPSAPVFPTEGEIWRPDAESMPSVPAPPSVMRLENSGPAHAAPARARLATVDLQAQAERQGIGRVRVAYLIAAISVVLLLAAILSAVAAFW